MSDEAQRLAVPYGSDGDPRMLIWWGARRGDGSRTAMLRCSAGHTCSLADHSIDDAGRVFPSVVCPAEGCTFHEWISLAGWRS
jgi:hypothetical protein